MPDLFGENHNPLLSEIYAALVRLSGRKPPSASLEEVTAGLAGRSILVTGAGGFLGSALTEALLAAGPARLTLVDNHENSLFWLRQRLALHEQGAKARYILADVRDRAKMAQVLEEASPEVIFHLAAYKHVHLAEEYPAEFVRMNVLATWQLCQEALKWGVERFVYPSSDKAVNNSGVYGSTKRTVELLLQALADKGAPTTFAAVRLVNVIGASGGVVQAFARQIAAGGPTRITHPEMTRYWISPPEALRLLTAAALLDGSGRVFLLELGRPVKVVAIAQELWSLLRPQEEFRFECIGMRPGERLHEELLHSYEAAAPTSFPEVLRVERKGGPTMGLAEITEHLAKLERLTDNGSAERRPSRLCPEGLMMKGKADC